MVSTGALPSAVPVVLNWMHTWWTEVMHCGCSAEAWLPCCLPDPCSADSGLAEGNLRDWRTGPRAGWGGLPLPPLTYALFRSRDAVAYQVAPCRRISLREWRQEAFSQHRAPFEVALPTHPTFGWHNPTFFEKVLAYRSRGNPGYREVRSNASSFEVDRELGFLCAILAPVAGVSRKGVPGFLMQDRLFEDLSGLALLERMLMSTDGQCMSWAIPFRFDWHGCIFGVLADLAALAGSKLGNQKAILNITAPPSCRGFLDAEDILSKMGPEVTRSDMTDIRLQKAQSAVRLCILKGKQMSFVGGEPARRLAWLQDGHRVFRLLGDMSAREAEALPRRYKPPAGRRLFLCSGGPGFGLSTATVPRLKMTGVAVEALLLGATLVGAVVELAFYVMSTSEGNRCEPFVDAVSALSLPHVALLDWRCKFRGDSGAPAAATVLNYYGTEVLVRCSLPASIDDASPMVLSLLPFNPADSAVGWALEELHFCPEVEPPRKRWRVSVCGQPMYGIGGREEELRQWIEYHRMEVGVEHFFLYDNDGSLASAVEAYVADGVVTYLPRWAQHFSTSLQVLTLGPVGVDVRASLRNWNATPKMYPSALSTQAETHCLFHTRYISDYTLFLHSLDAYLSVSPGGGEGKYAVLPVMGGLGDFLASLERAGSRDDLAAVAFPYIAVGGKPMKDARLVIERFQHVGSQPVVRWHLGANHEVEPWLQAAEPIVVPENVVSIVGSHWARGRPGTIHVTADEFKDGRIHHYVDMIKPRCIECTIFDGSMRAAAERLRKRLNDLDETVPERHAKMQL
eukprot:TRINITY_DN18606_c0_g1_i1.p1 TRINITY_DN18606_c0_g1~~TRINITY_DN18606_c0_g1_i1.p1  ORF type:complete len:796 (-),score=111.19 TRINITY_DN18606_c0_g1_i1:263-2650(-)